MNEVIYCYSCGKHVKREGGKCWYCSAPTRRTIRPARHCPYCDEEIGQKAIKCPHCGEFLDGRQAPRPQAAQAPQQVVYIIDKAVIQGQQPLALPGGSPVPPNIANRLSHQTLQAIETNEPRLIDQAGVKALPAPQQGGSVTGEASYVDVTPVETKSGPAFPVQKSALPDAQGPGPKAQAPGANPLVRRDENYSLVPAADPESTLAGTITRALVRSTGHALSAVGHFAYDTLTGAGQKEVAAETADDDHYRTCKLCHTEGLKTDNYCYHCGVTLREEAAARKFEIREVGPSNFGLYTACILLMVGFVALSRSKVLSLLPDTPTQYLAPGMAALTLLLVVVSFFRRRTTGNQILSILFFVILLCAALFAFVLE